MIKFDLNICVLFFQSIAVMSDNKPKLINHNETRQSYTPINNLNQLESAEKRKEILNGKKRTNVLFDKFYVKIREDTPLMESTFVLK